MVPFSISTDIGWRADLLNVSKVPEDVSDETLYVYGYDDRHLLYPNYKEGIRVLNQWYNEGLIWKDFALYTDASVEDDMMKSGFVGAFIHNWDYPYRNGEDSIQANLTRANGADAGFIAVDCFQNDAGITRKYLADRIDRKVFFPATNDEPLASLLYLNFISSEETIKFLQTGKEGVTYKMTDNGAYEMLNATGEWIMNSGMNSAFIWAMFCTMILTDISRPRMVESSFSKSSGRLTLAHSSITAWTWTGSLPPYFLSAS